MSKTLIVECVAEKIQHNLDEMTSEEFSKIIFAGADVNTPRGPSDAFTLDELTRINNSKEFDSWPTTDRFWLWSGIEFLDSLKEIEALEAKQTRPVIAAVAAFMLLLTPLAHADTIEVKDGKGKVILSLEQNKAGVNLRDAKGNVLATGTTAGKGDAVTLLTPKGKAITITKGGKAK